MPCHFVSKYPQIWTQTNDYIMSWKQTMSSKALTTITRWLVGNILKSLSMYEQGINLSNVCKICTNYQVDWDCLYLSYLNTTQIRLKWSRFYVFESWHRSATTSPESRLSPFTSWCVFVFSTDSEKRLIWLYESLVLAAACVIIYLFVGTPYLCLFLAIATLLYSQLLGRVDFG